uniref:Cytochrome c biogenesis factor C n=1 Tax=Jasminum nummulariifolium TaxID=2800392 RepID=A0A8T9KNF6_9LAMI|nr:cytochrome c biogenesis factor C [Jasminum sambac]UBB41912.1 cytochrome c biogenesis factor C [Jasminum fluminense]UBB41914.1 cytochrome c biogenesis factor C [Jasminum kitchingii]UBB41915.1 cytochrome c biogenesis factor C [Jasminum polyanthum]UOL65278.1 cytochrome c biogenesis factor C [Jasminum nummularifolium]WAI96581.1 cytochrome c biogenesis factor C [Jasminum sambac]
MVQLHNFFFLITSMVVPRGTAAPVLLKWFVSRDVPTGAPFSNGTIIPIPIPSFPLLVYLHSRKFIRSTDRAKSGVLVRASRPILLPDIIGRSSSETRARNALFRFVPVLHFLLLESKGDLSYLESFCGVLRLLFFRTFFFLPRDRSAKRERARRRKGQTLRPNGNEQRRNDKMRCPERRVEAFRPVAFPVPPSSGGACVGDAPPKIGLEALTLPTSRQLMAVGHDYYQKVNMKMNISHGGVCIFMLGVLLSNTKKIQFTQRLPLGSELHMGKERCCLRGLDHLHGPTFHSICGNLMIYKPNDRLMFEHDESLRADLLPIHFPASYENGKLEHFLHRWMKNREHNNFWLTMFPEKRYFRERTSTTEVAIHTNLFTDLYASIGTGSSRTGGWYTTIMKLPFLFFIRIGFMLASLGGSRSLLRQLQKDKLRWN